MPDYENRNPDLVWQVHPRNADFNIASQTDGDDLVVAGRLVGWRPRRLSSARSAISPILAAR